MSDEQQSVFIEPDLSGMWTNKDIYKRIEKLYPAGSKGLGDFMHLLTHLAFEMNYKEDDIYAFLYSSDDPDELLWSEQVYGEERDILINEVKIAQRTDVGIKGITTCRRCGKDEFSFSITQTRSADEGMTTKFRCMNCSSVHTT